MPVDLVFWLLPAVIVISGVSGYVISRLLSLRVSKRLYIENKAMALELDSIKVTCGQLESALENVELLHRSKNQFYYSTSHDLRQPLHALSMFSSVLQKQKLDDLSREIVADISDAVFDITREIDVLLNIARIDVEILKLHPVEVDLNSETRRIVHQFQRQAKAKGLALEVESCIDEMVFIDRVLFDRILRNLVDNAIKFTDQGYVTVSADYSPNGTLWLSVVDTGIGISKGDQDGIYREFYQGKGLSGNYLSGVGLGLNSVLKMITRLGGEINVESTGGSGTSVTLEIPNVVGLGKVQDHSVHNRLGDSESRARKTVLVLESEVLTGKSTIMLLESVGYSVELVSSLSEAYSALRSCQFDAACLELSSSNEAATQLIEELRFTRSDMPIVVLTSEFAAAANYADSSVSVLLKPANSQTLLKKLES